MALFLWQTKHQQKKIIFILLHRTWLNHFFKPERGPSSCCPVLSPEICLPNHLQVPLIPISRALESYHCTWWLQPWNKRPLLLGRKVMTNLDSLLKSRDITLPAKVCLVKAMVFPGVMYGCESWTIKKAEYWRIDAFELWCWTWESLELQGDPISPS